jgi:hypothetical protein
MTHDIARPAHSVFRGRLGPLLVAALVAACGGDDDDDGAADASGDDAPDDGDDGGDDDGPDASTGTDRTTGYVANPAGFVELVEGYVGEGGIGAVAVLRSAPDAPPASLVASGGACEVWTHPLEPAQCDPPCQDGVCVADDECAPFPAPIDAGEIQVTGLLDPLRFVPGELGYTSDPDLPPEDLFDDGAAIEVTAAGADAPAFALEATGVAPLEADLDLEFDTTLVLEDGVDREIRWTPGSGDAQVQIALQVGHHGAAYEALLVCEADDADGELVIPGDVIASLPRQSSGLEQHASWIQRFTRDVADSEGGPVQLEVASRLIILQLDHR